MEYVTMLYKLLNEDFDTKLEVYNEFSRYVNSYEDCILNFYELELDFIVESEIFDLESFVKDYCDVPYSVEYFTESSLSKKYWLTASEVETLIDNVLHDCIDSYFRDGTEYDYSVIYGDYL